MPVTSTCTVDQCGAKQAQSRNYPYPAPKQFNYKSIQLRRRAQPDRFQKKWLSELERHKSELHGSTQVSMSGSKTSESPYIGTNRSTSGETTPTRPTHQSPKRKSFIRPAHMSCSARGFPSDYPAFSDARVLREPNVPPKLAKALKLYRRTVEKRGELDEALVLYYQAFRAVCSSPPCAILVPAQDDKADRTYTRDQMLKSS